MYSNFKAIQVILVVVDMFFLSQGKRAMNVFYKTNAAIRFIILPDKYIVATTIVGCALSCQSDGVCVAASYQTSTRMCYMSSSECDPTKSSVGWGFISLHTRK